MIAPEYGDGHAYLAKTFLALGQPAAATGELHKEQDEEPRLDFSSPVLRAVGRTDEADAALQLLVARSVNDAYFIAVHILPDTGNPQPRGQCRPMRRFWITLKRP